MGGHLQMHADNVGMDRLLTDMPVNQYRSVDPTSAQLRQIGTGAQEGMALEIAVSSGNRWTAKKCGATANLIPLGSALLILIKYGEMKFQSMSGVSPLIGLAQGFDINQRQGDINGGL